MKFSLVFALLLSFLQSSFGQGPWQRLPDDRILPEAQRLHPSQFSAYVLDFAALKENLALAPDRGRDLHRQAKYVLRLPVGDQGLMAFAVYEAPVMAPDLQAKYPDIRTYTGQGIDQPRQVLKLDVGPTGLHAMIWGAGHTYAIEPMYEGDTEAYMAFSKADLGREPFRCGMETPSVFPEAPQARTSGGNPTGTELRTYRTAIGATGEYTAFHGGTKAGALAAIVTTMNRVNGIYERDFTVTMQLVPNNDTLIFTDTTSDPYTNYNLGLMLSENQALCDSLIGSANYDVGHVFGTVGGGLGGLGVVCTSSKAIGGTGLNSPVGDFFAVDYVSHEFGHQFSGNHTFNDCGNQAVHGYEPGSGVTIMAYAGLCGSSSIQSNSVDQFHVWTYEEVYTFVRTGNGGNCPILTPTGNQPPVVSVPQSGFYIPFQTPFELVASATDANNDSLTYCWEQFDLGPQTHPDSAVGTAPLFRTWPASPDPIRICPQISDLVTNTSTIGELLPQFGREMNFRVLVRDNVAGGGGADYAQLTFQVADSAGPFAVISPNGGQVWTTGSVQTVTWDVANSDLSPVNCQAVDIWLSEDGGYTYPHLIATNRPNNGSAAITVPNIPGNALRIKVKASNNIFFDISNTNFSIFPPTNPDFAIQVNAPVQKICGSDTVGYNIDLISLLGFNDPVNFALFGAPQGIDHYFSSNPATPFATVILSVFDTASVVPGDYTLTLQASSSSGVKNFPLTLRFRDGAPASVSLTTPFNGATSVSGNSIFSWNAQPYVVSYALEVSESPTFATLAYSINGIAGTSYIPSPNLNPNTIYYWRVQADQSDCGSGAWSPTWSFQTELTQCGVYMSIDTPVTISPTGTPLEYSELPISQNIVLTDVNVVDLEGVHTWVSDLNFRLINPVGDTITLFKNICGSDDDFDLDFDDVGLPGPISCPPTSGMAYVPVDPLSTFNNSNAQGTWYLEIFDEVGQDGGELQSWGLELCGQPISNAVPIVAITGATVSENDTLVLSSTYLNGNCNPTSSVLEYTLTSLPTRGNLLLNGVLLGIGDMFTQSDIDNNLLAYAHLGPGSAPDQFGFTIYCPAGAYAGGLTFPITVLPLVALDDAVQVDFSVSPNPSSSSFVLRYAQEAGAISELRLVDMLGRVLHEQEIEQYETTVRVATLPAGLYSCQLLQEGKLLGERKVIVVR